MINTSQINHIKSRLNTLRPSLTGKFFYYCIPFRKKVVLQNMRHVFSEFLSDKEIKKLAQCFYSHVATSLKENIMMRFMSLEQIKNRALFLGEEHLRKLINSDVKGAIILTGHFGNWEFAPIAGILNYPEYRGRFFFVRKLLATKWIEKIVFRRYYQAGLNVIPKKNSLDQVCEALETNNAVIFVMDQHASIKAKDGIMIDFFNKPAGTFRAPAMIARHTNVPILAGRSYRRDDGKHILELMPRIEWLTHKDPKEELAINTRQYNKILEEFILEYPEQWLWMHKRWKTS